MTTVQLDQLFASSEMGDSMDADLLRELSGGNMGGGHVIGVGTVRGGPGVVRMFGVVSGAVVLAVADRESVGVYGGEIVASPGSSGKVLSAGCAGSGASGYDSPVS